MENLHANHNSRIVREGGRGGLINLSDDDRVSRAGTWNSKACYEHAV